MNLKHILALGLTAGVLLSWTPAQAAQTAANPSVVSAQAMEPSITGTADSVSWNFNNQQCH